MKNRIIAAIVFLFLTLGTVTATGSAHLTTVADMERMGWVYTPPEENPLNEIRKLGPVSMKRTTLYGCGDNQVCLYQWVTYGAGRWGSTFANFWLHANDCINLSPATWPNGTPVSDNSGSMIINGTGSYPATTYASIYNYSNCSSSGGLASFAGDRVTGVQNLQNVQINPSTDAYHHIASVSFKTL